MIYLSPTKHLHNIPHTTSHRHDWYRDIRRKQLKYAYKLITATPEVEIYFINLSKDCKRKNKKTHCRPRKKLGSMKKRK